MKTAYVRQSQFKLGQISEQNSRKSGFEGYLHALQEAQNCIINPTSNIEKRHGFTQKIDLTATNVASKSAYRLLPFIDKNNVEYEVIVVPGYYVIIRDSDNTLIQQIVNTLTQTQVEELDYANVNDSLILVHNDIVPIRLYISNYVSQSRSGRLNLR